MVPNDRDNSFKGNRHFCNCIVVINGKSEYSLVLSNELRG